ncbi:MAG: hypothetical protein EAZ76_09955 [Nostocales cyanobacterium]|nr:MAG: hypothetical protein EAZ87_05710 [Nostocales cyanobacterium]TAF14223.1 MAG: hypothetical protein EAZ76_09955 [Nostocales cyanobacterium]
MIDLTALFEFSRANCAGVCTFLVPANILATLLTIILAVLNRPTLPILPAVGFASMLASVMIMHVYTWFVIGVVMLPTYILLGLALTCLTTNLAIMIWRRNSLFKFAINF